MKKKIKDLTFLEIMNIHNTFPCSECPLKDEIGNCIRSGTHYKFSEEFLNRKVEVEENTN
jgi:hypothetical protein